MIQKLSPTHSFGIEPYEKRLRLIVFENDNELVCRKENLKNLNEFLSATNMHIFKGRLQLMKSGDRISVQVKGEIVGQIEASDFQQLIPKK